MPIPREATHNKIKLPREMRSGLFLSLEAALEDDDDMLFVRELFVKVSSPCLLYEAACSLGLGRSQMADSRERT
jgi:hypothetical protein